MTLIGHRCKYRNIFSRVILITRRLNKQEIIIIFITLICHNKTYGDYCAGDHLFPSRTEKLSPVALMVLE